MNKHSRDYVMVIVRYIRRAAMPEMLKTFKTMYGKWTLLDGRMAHERLEEPGYTLLKRTEAAHMQQIRVNVEDHASPLVHVGFGASSFAKKYTSLAHTLRSDHFSDSILAYAGWLTPAQNRCRHACDRLLSAACASTLLIQTRVSSIIIDGQCVPAAGPQGIRRTRCCTGKRCWRTKC